MVAAVACLGGTVWTAHYAPAYERIHSHQFINLEALGYFELPASAADATIPPNDRSLDGKSVVMAGFIVGPPSSTGRTAAFQLVYNPANYWGTLPKVQERVFCAVPNGGTVPTFDRDPMISVYGRPHVGIRRDTSGQIESVYRLDVDRVDPVP